MLVFEEYFQMGSARFQVVCHGKKLHFLPPPPLLRVPKSSIAAFQQLAVAGTSHAAQAPTGSLPIKSAVTYETITHPPGQRPAAAGGSSQRGAEPGP